MKKLTITTISIIIVIAIAIIAINISSPSSEKPQQPEVIKIGFIGPLTGPAANIGIAARTTTDIAIQEINSTNTKNIKFELIVEDSACDPKKSLSAASKLIATDNVHAIIGDLCSGGTLAFAPVAEASQTIVISYGSTINSLSNAGEYIFRTIPSDAALGVFVAEYAYDQLHSKNSAVIYYQSEYSTSLAQTYSDSFEKLGGKITLTEDIARNETDFRTIITKINDEPTDLIYAPLYPESMIAFISQYKQFGLTQPIISTDIMEDTSIIQAVGSAANDIQYALAFLPDQTMLQGKLHSVDPNLSVTLGAPQAYDATHILAQVIQEVGTNPEDIKNALYSISYDGASGHIEFDENGDLKSTKYTVKKIIDAEQGEIIELE